MPVVGDKTRRFAANSMCPSFFCGQIGLVLAQMAAAEMHGGRGLRVLVGLPGLVLLGLELFRARRHWAAAGADLRSADARALAWYLVLLASGAAIGAVIRAGSLLLLGAAAAVTYVVPWTTVPLCRARFVAASTAIAAGAVGFLVIHGVPAGPLYLLVAAWTLTLPSISMHLVVLATLEPGYRIDEPRPAMTTHRE